MKAKKFTYLLLACVAGVWSVIFYRIYTSVGEEEERFVIADHNVKPEYFKLVNHETDNIKLNLNYRDPFTTTSNLIEELPERNAKNDFNLPALVPIPKPQVNWSAIKYTGYIHNASTKQIIAIIHINGIETMLTEGESMQGLKLIKYAGDSVKVKYQNSIKYIKIK